MAPQICKGVALVRRGLLDGGSAAPPSCPILTSDTGVKMLGFRSMTAVAVFAALGAACKPSGGGASRSHETLASIEPLRAAFNADSGKVRAIFLASPT